MTGILIEPFRRPLGQESSDQKGWSDWTLLLFDPFPFSKPLNAVKQSVRARARRAHWKTIIKKARR